MPFLKSPILWCIAQRFFLSIVLTKEMLQLRNDTVSIRQTDQNRDRDIKVLSPRRLVLPFPNRSHDLRTVYGMNSRTRASDQLKIVTGFLQRPAAFNRVTCWHFQRRINPNALSKAHYHNDTKRHQALRFR